MRTRAPFSPAAARGDVAARARTWSPRPCRSGARRITWPWRCSCSTGGVCTACRARGRHGRLRAPRRCGQDPEPLPTAARAQVRVRKGGVACAAGTITHIHAAPPSLPLSAPLQCQDAGHVSRGLCRAPSPVSARRCHTVLVSCRQAPTLFFPPAPAPPWLSCAPRLAPPAACPARDARGAVPLAAHVHAARALGLHLQTGPRALLLSGGVAGSSVTSMQIDAARPGPASEGGRQSAERLDRGRQAAGRPRPACKPSQLRRN